VSAALFWVLRAYVVAYAFLGLSFVVLIVPAVLKRSWSAVVVRWSHAPSRYSGAPASWTPDETREIVGREFAGLRLQPLPVRTRR
jgi:hypothetical protein